MYYNSLVTMREERETMQKELEMLKEKIVQDYATWCGRCTYLDEARGAERITEFAEALRIEEGRKYMKVITGNSVWGFVMKEADKMFKAGDILKAAGWAAPARNKPRGNVLVEDFTWVRWTGPEYL